MTYFNLHNMHNIRQQLSAHKVALVVMTLFVAAVFALSTLLTPQRSGLAQTATAPVSQAPLDTTQAATAADTAQQVETPEQRFVAKVGITEAVLDLNTRTLDVRKMKPLPVQQLTGIDRETLWLARAVYSETKRPEEMELVAWTIRNRVETSYRGKGSYESVVLDPWQFSAFNHNSPKRSYFTKLSPQSNAEKWQDALTIAHVVKHAPASLRPFSKQTRHYYSERSMVGRKQPAWAVGEQPITPNRPFEVEAKRFRFYENVA